MWSQRDCTTIDRESAVESSFSGTARFCDQEIGPLPGNEGKAIRQAWCGKHLRDITPAGTVGKLGIRSTSIHIVPVTFPHFIYV